MHSDEQLSSLVVHGVSDALDLLLESFVQLPQGLHRILKAAVRHFIRRQTLRKEFGARPEQFLPAFFTPRIANQRKHSLVMQGSHLYETLLLGDRSTRTSASSFPLRCRTRILSAALCGFSRAERVTEKSLRTPSVAKKSVSPFTTGSTVV